MIARLSGQLIHRGVSGVILDVGGVGYLVEVPLSTLTRLPEVGQPATLHIHTHVRDDALRLYGFDSLEALRLFEKLISVSGVGPRIALNALGQLSSRGLHRAIVGGDVRTLCRVNGIGRRTAERIIIDLGDPLRRLELPSDELAPGPQGGATASMSSLNELEEALKYLGFDDKSVRRAVRLVGQEAGGGETVEELLRTALKVLQ